MCVVSMIGDYYKNKFDPYVYPPQINTSPPTNPIPKISILVTQEEFNALKKEVEDMKELLRRAKIYDEQNGEPDCEMDSKMDLLRKVAEAVGINLDDVLGKK